MAAEVMHEYTADEKRYYRLLSEMNDAARFSPAFALRAHDFTQPTCG